MKHVPLFQKNLETAKKNFASEIFHCDFKKYDFLSAKISDDLSLVINSKFYFKY